MIDKIKFDSSQEGRVDLDFMKLQIDPMKQTWNNKEDEAWNDL
jgi:hypothetical protein